jgi:hypothetical protein
MGRRGLNTSLPYQQQENDDQGMGSLFDIGVRGIIVRYKLLGNYKRR